MLPELFQIDTVLITAHTVIRRFRENEGETFYELLDNNRSRIEDLFAQSVMPVTSKEECEMFVRRKLASWLLQQEFSFGVWHNATAKAIGFVELFHLDWSVPKAGIMFFVDREHEGKGVMTEVVREVIRFAFAQLNLQRIDLHTASDNFAAQRLARKCGFRREGDLRTYFRKAGGELVDVMLLAVTR